MGRLYDRLVRTKSLNAEFKELLPQAVVILANNVDEFVSVNKPSMGSLREIPCVAPPFDNFFVEINLGNKIDDIGFHCVVADCYKGHSIIDPNFVPTGNVDDFRWRYIVNVYYGYQVIKYKTQDWRGIAYIGDRGDLLDFGLGSRNAHSENVPRDLHEDSKRYIFSGFLRFWWTLAFMNVKNSVLIDNPPPAKLSKRHEKKYGVPLVTDKILKVTPMNKVNANDYDSDDGDSIDKALHIVRGHFATYTAEQPMFGKYVGTFWKEAHLRGNAEKGVVVKDYEVMPE